MATKCTRAKDLRGGVQTAEQSHHKLRGRGTEGSDDQRAQRSRNAFDCEENAKIEYKYIINQFERMCLQVSAFANYYFRRNNFKDDN